MPGNPAAGRRTGARSTLQGTKLLASFGDQPGMGRRSGGAWDRHGASASAGSRDR